MTRERGARKTGRRGGTNREGRRVLMSSQVNMQGSLLKEYLSKNFNYHYLITHAIPDVYGFISSVHTEHKHGFLEK